MVTDLNNKKFVVFIVRLISCRDLPNLLVLMPSEKALKPPFYKAQSWSTHKHYYFRRYTIPCWCARYFGGPWESAVKSFKHNLRHIILPLEEITTLIEAMLNYRPLTLLSNDPSVMLFALQVIFDWSTSLCFSRPLSSHSDEDADISFYVTLST